MIRSARYRNFKGLRDVQVDFERFTVLVGPNASGKTSILQGLDYLSKLRDLTPQQVFQDILSPWNLFSRSGSGDLAIELSTGEQSYLLRLASPPGVPIESAIRDPHLQGPWKYSALTRATHEAGWVDLGQVVTERRALPTTLFLRLEAEAIAAPSTSGEEKPHLSPNGKGIASALAYLALNQPGTFADLKRHLCQLLPYVKELRFNRVKLRESDEHRNGPLSLIAEEFLFDVDGAPGIRAPHVSDGTLLVVGLLTAIYAGIQPQVLLLDDLDQGLHPRAQRELVGLLRQILEEKPYLQIIATTHSPYLLDQMQPHEVRLTTRTADGSVACAPLEAHPDFPRWKELMAPGEFWSLVGEKWVAERAPQEIAP